MNHNTHTNHPRLYNQERTYLLICIQYEIVHVVELAAWLSEHQILGGISGAMDSLPPPSTSYPYDNHSLCPTLSYLL